MKSFLVILLAMFVLAVTAQELCKWRKNYVYYSVSGEANVTGVSLANARNCVRRAFHLYENAMLGYYFDDTAGYLYELPDVQVQFISFARNYPVSLNQPAFTTFNCTDDGINDAEVIRTIRSGTIFINTDVAFHCGKDAPNSETVNLFIILLHEIGYLVGLADNADQNSIMFNPIHIHNFRYVTQDCGLNPVDVQHLGELYFKN